MAKLAIIAPVYHALWATATDDSSKVFLNQPKK